MTPSDMAKKLLHSMNKSESDKSKGTSQKGNEVYHHNRNKKAKSAIASNTQNKKGKSAAASDTTKKDPLNTNNKAMSATASNTGEYCGVKQRKVGNLRLPSRYNDAPNMDEEANGAAKKAKSAVASDTKNKKGKNAAASDTGEQSGDDSSDGGISVPYDSPPMDTPSPTSSFESHSYSVESEIAPSSTSPQAPSYSVESEIAPSSTSPQAPSYSVESEIVHF